MSKLSIRNPSSEFEMQARDALLQLCLRDPTDFKHSFSICEEYPIVLAPEKQQYSHLVFNDKLPVAHLNTWPRAVHNQEGDHQYNVLLVGNVCTHPKFRGRGFARSLLHEATSLFPQCSAMILWSDLDQFYQKLGFSSLNQELRFFFDKRKFSKNLVNLQSSIQVKATATIHSDLTLLRRLRPDLLHHLYRSHEDMRNLLSIPDCYYLYSGDAELPDAYAFIGKGADLQGVIHEWGAQSTASMIHLLANIMQKFSFEHLLLLAPSDISENWKAAFDPFLEKYELHSMALAKALGDFDIRRLRDLFIWGMDSI